MYQFAIAQIVEFYPLISLFFAKSKNKNSQ